MTTPGQEILRDFTNDHTSAVVNSLYPVEIILWTNVFMAHNVVIKKCGSVHTCITIIGRPNDDWSGNYLYLIWLGNIDDDRHFVGSNLAKELNT